MISMRSKVSHLVVHILGVHAVFFQVVGQVLGHLTNQEW